MKVLHYSLGFPPYRTGGLVRFCIDLMKFQKNCNIEVCMLWPGRIRVFNSKIKVVESIDKLTKLKSYELLNPLPVSLDEGIKEIDQYMKDVDKNYYIEILKRINPNIIHVHTLMGIHKSFFEAAKELKIKLIFTPHDYFGICPKLNFFFDGKVCDDNFQCTNCIECNKKALSRKKIFFLQSRLYRLIKNTRIMKIIRNIHRMNFFKDSNDIKLKKDTYVAKKYMSLRKYYIDIIKEFDLVHFNSELTKEIYFRYVDIKNYKILNISHDRIKDNRVIKNFDDKKLRISYMASTKPYKGFYLLLESLDKIWKKNIFDFRLSVYANTNEKRPYMDVKGNYDIKDLSKIFDKTDVLVAPSIWYETYGYIVVEAISYGVPVIITQNVGAKNIVGKAGIVIKPNNSDELEKVISDIVKNKNILKKMNKETFNCILPNMKNMLTLLEEKK